MSIPKFLRILSWLFFGLMLITVGLILFAPGLSGKTTAETSSVNDLFDGYGIWSNLLIGFAVAAIVFLLASFAAEAISNQRIVSNGLDAEAEILQISDTGSRINDNPVVDFIIEVRPGNNPAFIAKVRQTVSILHLSTYQQGKTVFVKYIPGTEKATIIGVKS